MKIEKVRFFDPGISSCELKMQHTSREIEPYWLSANLFLYAGKERRNIIFLGAGSKSESEKVIQLLESQGFIQTSSRLNQEWYQISFKLDNNEPEDDKLTNKDNCGSKPINDPAPKDIHTLSNNLNSNHLMPERCAEKFPTSMCSGN